MKKNKAAKRLLAIIMAWVMLACLCFTSCDKAGDEVSNATKIPVLTYHKIIPAGHDFDSGLLITADTFEEQMKYLHDEGFTTLTLDEFYDWYKGEAEVPEKSVVVTFDDGFYGTYYLAYPIIKKYDQAATVFCIGHITEDTTPAWDDQEDQDYRVGFDVIQKLREEYPKFSFESHTYDMHRKRDGKHPADIFTYDQMIDDIKQNEVFGFRYLAYPWGDYNETFEQALKDSGYKMAFAYKPPYYATQNDDMYAVNRIKISGKMKMKKFKKIVSGDYEDYNYPDS